MDSLEDTVLEFGTYQGVAVQITFHPPFNGRYQGVAAGVSISADKMEEFLHQEHFRLLSKRLTPAGALLGAAPQEDGSVAPMVSVEDTALAAKRVEKLTETPLQKEFSPALADELNLNLVSDHYTRSNRYRPEGERAVRPVLEKAMTGYESVARQQGTYLLARSMMWPDRDEEEIPGTQADKWIAAKQSGAGLGVDDFALMNRLPERQLDGLASYMDLPLHLRAEVFLVRRHRWLLTLFEALPRAQRAAARGKTGLALNRMSLKHRVFLLRSAGYTGPFERLNFYLVEQESPLRKDDRSFTAYLMEPRSSGPVWASN